MMLRGVPLGPLSLALPAASELPRRAELNDNRRALNYDRVPERNYGRGAWCHWLCTWAVVLCAARSAAMII
eukprot:CAMPEP_0202887244 /NCGR_PEP_ID=MMETSP1391-20130828/42583_1 /ASSEMBLY_ACC=CAM_ASM_000867 /TAXON_ID=1034604 /ORGANISM="Chlamydomonas leiostraca, Strain SAG 11-49" /LENGTH=70 /DNA_ID=CAMNT_0049570527 /DNA_START=32 /DNA_END=244 /DNA_ORIENTATION=-